jgi:hypothetical protein
MLGLVHPRVVGRGRLPRPPVADALGSLTWRFRGAMAWVLGDLHERPATAHSGVFYSSVSRLRPMMFMVSPVVGSLPSRLRVGRFAGMLKCRTRVRRGESERWGVGVRSRTKRPGYTLWIWASHC